jgi:putative cardiolipin synthase
MAALDAHPHFEIRIFNPFSRRKGWALDFVTDFDRVNRRMHNKSFTVDSQATVVGGRNIGAEYFSAREDVNFGDLDLLGFGPVAEEVGAAFDEYWNSELAVPVSAVVAAPEDPEAELEALRGRLAAALSERDSTPYEAALHSSIVDSIGLDADRLEWAPCQVVYDAPEKALDDGKGGVERITTPLATALDETREEFLLVSPYFVPLDRGVERFRKLRERGVRVVAVTNTLAATDVAAVHAGYAAYRKDLLEIGVELYEVRGDQAVSGAARGGMAFSRASLHAKGFVIDRRQLFVGSFNWDPRSALINTEMGILVDSPVLAKQVTTSIERGIPERSYRVVLDESGRLRWIGHEEGQEVVLDREPQASLWRRFVAGFLRLLPIERQL